MPSESEIPFGKFSNIVSNLLFCPIFFTQLMQNSFEIKNLAKKGHTALAKTEIIYPKNLRAKIAMDFT